MESSRSAFVDKMDHAYHSSEISHTSIMIQIFLNSEIMNTPSLALHNTACVHLPKQSIGGTALTGFLIACECDVGKRLKECDYFHMA